MHNKDDLGVFIAFRAKWVSGRAFGTCWVRAPILVGPEANTALNYAAWIPVPAGGYLVTDVAQSRITSTEVDATQAVPTPDASLDSWSCSTPVSDSVIAARQCDALASIDAPWRAGFRDAALVILGVLLSLAAEFWIRVLPSGRRRDSADVNAA